MQSALQRVRAAVLHATPSLIAGCSAVAGSLAAVGFADGFVGSALAAFALEVLPPFVFALGIGWLGPLAAPLLVAMATFVAIAIFAAIVEFGNRATVDRSPIARGCVVFVLLAGLATAMTGSPASGAGAGIAGTLATAVAGVDVEGDGSTVRRRLLRASGVFVGTLGLGGVLAVQRDRASTTSRTNSDRSDSLDDEHIHSLLELAEERSFDFPDADHLVSDAFYRVDITFGTPPSVDPGGWSLRIHGAVDQELVFDYDDVTSLATEHRFVTLRCVGEDLNGFQIDTALWTGTPLSPVLEAAGAGEDCCVRLSAVDDYYQAFQREALERGFLAWGMNGEPLPARHGAPVRVLIPGHWGEINVKWLEDVEILSEPATGYWEERGWHGTGPVETVAKLHSRRRDGDRVVIGGPAYAGVRGISRVEVSTDGGENWAEAELTDPLPAATPAGSEIDPESRAIDAWRQWRHEYENPDRHEVTVRAYERDGTVQPKEQSNSYPSGATGWVTEEMYANRG